MSQASRVLSRILVEVFTLTVLLVASASAQVSTADITGTVQDQNGAAVTGANVTITSTATGLQRTAVTGDTGDYSISLLPPGDYELKASATGFATVAQKLTLVVGQRQTLNFTLRPGAVTEVINVTGEVPLVETTKSEIGGAVTPLEVKELPILDRNFAGLTYIIPGIRPAEGFDPTKTRVGNFTSNGGDGRAVDVNVDGGDNKDNVVGGMLQAYTLEGIQEFNVVTDRYTAESGRSVATIINVVSKSGTNSFHGSAFGLFISPTFNKRDAFTGEKGNPQHRYHFGGSGGGPIIKDKFFFFAAYEQKREPTKIGVDADTFSELSLFPLAKPVAELPTTYIDHLLTLKLDQRISSKQTIYYRYGRQRWIVPNDQLGAVFNSDGSGGTNNTNQFHDFVFSHNYTLSSSKVNSFTFHFQDFVNQISAKPLTSFTLPVTGGGAVTNPEICFFGACGDGLPEFEIGNNINVPQQTLIRKYQFRDDFVWTHGRHNMKFGGNWVYNAKLGGNFFFAGTGYQMFFATKPSDIRAVCPAFNCSGDVMGLTELLFTGGQGDFKQRPHQLAFYFQDDYKVTPHLTLNLGLRWDTNIRFLGQQLTGDPLTSNRVALVMRQVIAANPSAPAAQDGLNYIKDVWGDESALRRTTANWKEFQPRIGFAWDPNGNGKLVIRGGYGIAFDQIFQNLTLFGLQLSNPFIYTTVLDCTSGPPGPGCPDFATFRPFVDPLPAPPAFSTSLPAGSSPVRINDPHLTDPYAQQWSLGGAWEFRPEWAFSVDYYHVLGIHEQRALNANPRIRNICDPAYGGNLADPRCVSGAGTRFLAAAFQAAGLSPSQIGEIRKLTANNRSRYDGINFVLRRRFSHNYTMQASYVLSWSRSWGGVPTASYLGTGARIDFRDQFKPGQYGPTNFDERHRVVVSGVFNLPYGFEIAPIFQAASARPYSAQAGVDINGDGVTNLNDLVCVGSTPGSPIITPACQQVSPNSLRGDPLFQLDSRFAKAFRFKEHVTLRLYWELYNIFNTLNTGNNVNAIATSSCTGAGCIAFPSGARQPNPSFGNAVGYFGGQGFGAPTSGPLRSQFGLRFEF
jgi:Carboxypeptidase regulatory-like domain/TonB dependent receptor